MKACVFTKSGSAVAIEIVDQPTPAPGPDEALIKVKACALNRLDLGVLEGKFPVAFPHIGGSDVAGEIQGGTTAFKPGDAVIVNPSLPCGKCSFCRSSKACESVKIFGYHTPGGLAGFVTVPVAQLYPKPASLSWEQGAAFPLTFLTAWHMLKARARLESGETVFIWGASGGLGTAAVQIARNLGATVIAAVGNADAADRLSDLGAHHVLDYHDDRLSDRVRDLTGGRGVHVVFESVGAATWSRTMDMLRPLGRVVIAGTTGGQTIMQDLSELYFKQQSIIGARMGSTAEFEQVLKLINRGKLKPVASSSYPLTRTREALGMLKNRQVFGKIVITL